MHECTNKVLINLELVKLPQAIRDILGIQCIYELLIRQIHKKGISFYLVVLILLTGNEPGDGKKQVR